MQIKFIYILYDGSLRIFAAYQAVIDRLSLTIGEKRGVSSLITSNSHAYSLDLILFGRTCTMRCSASKVKTNFKGLIKQY